ncbi:nicotinamide-nucleotide adenylyltransferase [Candidatus Woesearchaeota archaeon]|nr:nicotinamide-nucleotide adenylyltransferase [Candidatus Woesearchaeota archaeon]
MKVLPDEERKKTALFIGRFQPFHNAHLSDIRLALRECSRVIIAIGSSQEENTKENPFSYGERERMIRKALKANKIADYDIIAVPDVNDNKKWVEHVRKIAKGFDIAYTGNDLTEKLFREKGMRVRKIRLIPHINATEIRKRILHGNDWKELVPKEVSEVIERIKGIERITEINNK